jgi:hypothetical protein
MVGAEGGEDLYADLYNEHGEGATLLKEKNNQVSSPRGCPAAFQCRGAGSHGIALRAFHCTPTAVDASPPVAWVLCVRQQQAPVTSCGYRLLIQPPGALCS